MPVSIRAKFSIRFLLSSSEVPRSKRWSILRDFRDIWRGFRGSGGEVKPFLDKMIREGVWISEMDYERILRQSGEEPW